ncbi:NucA/NucB deoxyribonuclease domain-containing protein [Dactylosporangium sp. NPDC005555]|uniref:NucA/NucB deoxyribonuclease domain-containing protein n=1 Tax=Dactylosporangium sp. NPDC005555 TaxID=3154889 RepID=UPI0033B119D2
MRIRRIVLGFGLVLALVPVAAVSPAAASPVPVVAPAAVAPAAAPRLQFNRLEEDDFETQCLAAPSAAVDPGWFPDRYAHCRRGTGIHDVFDANNVKVGEVHVSLIVMGFAVNGERRVDYAVRVLGITKVNAPDLLLETVSIGMWFACGVSLTPCADPAAPSRVDTVTGWRAVNYFTTTLTSPETADPGEQRVQRRFALVVNLTTPGQPFLPGPPIEAMYSNVRYDSASYVGRARGTVFLDHRLVLVVDERLDNQDESAQHIRHAFNHPVLTFPSWVGKTVPGKDDGIPSADDEPLTRMYNNAQNDANRANSEKICKELYGLWDKDLVNCDEFPFASTYEGSKTGTEANNGLQRFSVRLIDTADNQYVGGILLEVNFYRALRVLDGDKFFVRVVF